MSTTEAIPDSVTAFDISNREALLQALVKIIKEQWPWLKTVRRQALEGECLAAPELPAVLIDELSSDYTFDQRFCDGQMRLVPVFVFDVQVECKRDKKNPLGNVSTIRELMVRELLSVLQNNPTLHTQLPGEDESQDHVIDAFNGASVRYVKTKFPTARALVTVRMLTSESFLKKSNVNFTQLILTAKSSREGDEVLTATFDLSNDN